MSETHVVVGFPRSVIFLLASLIVGFVTWKAFISTGMDFQPFLYHFWDVSHLEGHSVCFMDTRNLPERRRSVSHHARERREDALPASSAYTADGPSALWRYTSRPTAPSARLAPAAPRGPTAHYPRRDACAGSFGISWTLRKMQVLASFPAHLLAQSPYCHLQELPVPHKSEMRVPVRHLMYF